jgi:hypothetical protein
MTLFFYIRIQQLFFSLLKQIRDWKMKKIKFYLKIEFLTTKMIVTYHLKKKKGLEWTFCMKFKVATYFPCFFLLWSLVFQFNHFFKKKKKTNNWTLIWAQKGSIMQKQSSRTWLNFFKKPDYSNPRCFVKECKIYIE